MKRSPMRTRLRGLTVAVRHIVSARPSAAALLVQQALTRAEAPRSSTGANRRQHAVVEKEGALQNAGYINVVRRMACMHCRRPPPSQFCHADYGKGKAIKTDCRRGWPGCADGPGYVGCHTLVGTSGRFSRDERRELEEHLASLTREHVLGAGLWPADLPLWG